MNSIFGNMPQSIWQYLSKTNKKIILYGMGDGAEKVSHALNKFGKQPDDIMASDGFVRGQEFMGKRVKTLDEIKTLYPNFIILVCFGSNIPEVYNYIFDLSKKHELYLPHVPVNGENLFDSEYFEENKDRFEKLYNLLADEESKKTLVNIIHHRLTGKLDYLQEIMHNREETLALLNLSDSEIYADLGAYNGDTVDEFIGLTQGSFKKIIALEPDSKNYIKMRRRFYMLNSTIFEAHNAGIWSHNTELPFAGKRGRGSKVGVGKTIKAYSVDSLFKDYSPTYIKYDIEGCENQAINGSKRIITENKPKLCISAYHRVEDLLELPLLVSDLRADYKIYLRHDACIPDWDSCYYCI